MEGHDRTGKHINLEHRNVVVDALLGVLGDTFGDLSSRVTPRTPVATVSLADIPHAVSKLLTHVRFRISCSLSFTKL
jgi:hypothetical protein